MSSSGVIVSPSDVPVGQPQPLTTGVSCTDTGIVATPFVVPPSPDIEQPCRQLQDSPMCRTPEHASLGCGIYRPFLLTEISSSGVRSLPRTRRRGICRSCRRLHLRLTVFDLSAESRRVRRATPSCRRMTVFVRCEPFPGSDCPSPLPACATVRLVLSAGPSGASDWVGSQDLYHAAGGITYLCIGHSLVRPFCSDDRHRDYCLFLFSPSSAWDVGGSFRLHS